MSVTPLALNPHEIFERLQAYKIRSKKVECLSVLVQSRNDFIVKSLLQANFHPGIVFDLPEGAPPFKRDLAPVGRTFGRLRPQIMKLSLLLNSSKLPRVKKEKIFVEILESVHPKDADIIIAVKDKKIQDLYPSLTLDIVKEAFPKLALEQVKK